MLLLKEKKEYLSVTRRVFLIWLTTMVLITSIGFATGYLYHDQADRAPIVIEKCG